MFALATIGSSYLVPPIASATPECITIAPHTTRCDTGGSSQVVTSPSVQTGPYQGWAWGPVGIGGRVR